MTSYRSHFPLFTTHPNLVYLDSAATTQKPEVVIEAISNFYRTSNANIHRGLYPLSVASTQAYEEARHAVAQFICADSDREIVFTRNATEGINLLAHSLAKNLQRGDEIILSDLEHHANIVPWQQLAQEHGAVLRFSKITEQGEIDYDHFSSLITPATRIVSLSHCSNVFGTFLSPTTIKKILEKQGSQALFIVDASQSIAHTPISIQDLGCDFLVFSGHKLYAPSGIGVLWGRETLLSSLDPYQTGGDMIRTVTIESSTWNDLPWKFEAGTPNIEGAIGLAAALTYLQDIGMDIVQSHTTSLTSSALSQLSAVPSVHILGTPQPEAGIISFTLKDIHPHDLAELLGQKNVCIRAGHHCAAPLHKSLDLTASNRISFGIYSTEEDITTFIEALKGIIKDFYNV